MKFERTEAFKRDFKRLPDNHKATFREFVPAFHAAAQRAAAGDSDPWPRGMRVKSVGSAEGVWELTWSMNDPDGRATWEWTEIDGERAVRWRRVGDHGVLDNA